jgi:hypothetical protein
MDFSDSETDSAVSTIYSKFISLPSNVEAFKDAANAALKSQFVSAPYDEVQVVGLNWRANDLGLKRQQGSLILDETKELMRVFRDSYHFQARHRIIPSKNPEKNVQKWLSDIIYDLSEKELRQKKNLLIIYYNGHGAVKDGKLIWSA